MTEMHNMQRLIDAKHSLEHALSHLGQSMLDDEGKHAMRPIHAAIFSLNSHLHGNCTACGGVGGHITIGEENALTYAKCQVCGNHRGKVALAVNDLLAQHVTAGELKREDAGVQHAIKECDRCGMLEAALKDADALVAKMDAIQESMAYRAVWEHFHVTGHTYRGETWVEERERYLERRKEANNE